MTDETKQVLEVVKEMFEALNAKIDGLGTEMKTRMAKIETTLENDTNNPTSCGGLPIGRGDSGKNGAAFRGGWSHQGRRGHHQEGCHDAFRGA